MTKPSQWFLSLNALILAAYALAFLINPALLGKLIGFTSQSPNTLVEVSAFYGGLELGLAAFLFWSSLHTARLSFALTLFLVVFLTTGLCRALGLARFGFADPSQPIVTAIEIIFSLTAAWLNRSLKNQSPPSKT